VVAFLCFKAVTAAMGVGRVFPGGALGNFSKIFQGGKSEEICFFPYETKKTTSFAKIF